MSTNLQLTLYDDNTYQLITNIPYYGSEGSKYLSTAKGQFTKTNQYLTLSNTAVIEISISNGNGGGHRTQSNTNNLSEWFPTTYKLTGYNKYESNEGHITGFHVIMSK